MIQGAIKDRGMSQLFEYVNKPSKNKVRSYV